MKFSILPSIREAMKLAVKETAAQKRLCRLHFSEWDRLTPAPMNKLAEANVCPMTATALKLGIEVNALGQQIGESALWCFVMRYDRETHETPRRSWGKIALRLIDEIFGD